MNIPINKNAPVKSGHEIVINAPVEIVWQVLTSINNWPEWQANVTESRLNGDLAEGGTFNWKAGGIRFKSSIHTIKLYALFGWTGKTFGAAATHNWRFDETNGKTKVYVEESLQGLFPSLLKGYFQKSLDEGMKISLEELKLAAEEKSANSNQG